MKTIIEESILWFRVCFTIAVLVWLVCRCSRNWDNTRDAEYPTCSYAEP